MIGTLLRTWFAVATGLGLAAVANAMTALPQNGTIQNITFSPASPVTAGTTVTITVTASTPCGAIGIDYGDGASAVYPISGPPLTQNHTYANPGTYTVKATGHGNCSGEVTRTLQVNAPPAQTGQVQNITFSPASPVTAGTSVAVTVTASAPCGTIALDYGDGVTATIMPVQLPITQTHPYPTAGTFTVRATGQGNCTGQVTRALQVNATSPPGRGTAPPTGPAAGIGIAQIGDLAIQSVDVSPTGDVRTIGFIEYRVTVRYSGPTAVSNVLVRAAFNEAGWRARAEGPGQGCAITEPPGVGPYVDCTIPSLAPGASAVVTIRMITPSFQPATQFERTTAVQFRVDPLNVVRELSDDNNIRMVPLRLVKLPDLDPSAVGSPTTASAERTISYPLQMRNVGEGPATNPALRITMPTGFRILRFENSNAACTKTAAPDPRQSGDIARCAVPRLGPGDGLAVRVVAESTVTEVTGGQALVTLRADPDDAILESNETNNTAGVATTLTATVDLTIQSYSVRYEFKPVFRAPNSASCIPEADLRDTTISVVVRNLGQGLSRAGTLRMAYVAGFERATDCVGNATCRDGICVLVPLQDGMSVQTNCFDTCPIPALQAGESRTIVLTARRPRDVDTLGEASILSNPTSPDVNPNNNRRTIRRAGN